MTMRTKTKTIKSQLFWNYSPIIIAFILITTVVFYVFASRSIRERAFDTLAQVSNNISEQVDNELINMNEVSKRISYSNLVKTRFIDYLENPSGINLHFSQQALRDIFIAIMGPVDKQYQINLFDLNGKVVGAGEINTMADRNVESMPWYVATVERDGAKYITLPYKDYTRSSAESVVSLCRTYFDDYYKMVGIIEIQQKHGDLFEFLIGTSFGTGEFEKYLGTYVFGAEGDLVFPDPASVSPKELDDLNEVMFSGNGIIRSGKENLLRRDHTMISRRRGDFSGWYVVNILPESVLLRPLLIFVRNMILFSMITVIVSLAASLLIAGRLTRPISQLQSTVNSLTLDSVPEEIMNGYSTDFNELEKLNVSFRNMHARLQKAAKDLVLSKSHELQARMLALQSKMNPHFVYNTITNISVMAEEGSTKEIRKICGDLSGMLRYISSENGMVVSLRQELDHLNRYLDLMRHRYEGNIIGRVEIPLEMRDIMVPKLILQPLVENSLTYGIHVTPPWNVEISGSMDGGKWLITVRDNGGGFSEQVLADLNRKMYEMDPASVMPGDGLKGIGLLNIYARMRMLYKKDTIFRMYNRVGRGACVELGGTVTPEEDWRV